MKVIDAHMHYGTDRNVAASSAWALSQWGVTRLLTNGMPKVTAAIGQCLRT